MRGTTAGVRARSDRVSGNSRCSWSAHWWQILRTVALWSSILRSLRLIEMGYRNGQALLFRGTVLGIVAVVANGMRP